MHKTTQLNEMPININITNKSNTPKTSLQQSLTTVPHNSLLLTKD